MEEDKRIIRRRRVLRSGKIIYGDGALVVDCVIRDVSVGGARLDVPVTIAIPHSFILVDVQAARRYAAKVMWRRAGQMGVDLDDIPEEQDDR